MFLFDSTLLSIQQLINPKYEIISQLGKGAFAKVYLAKDNYNNKVALKCININTLIRNEKDQELRKLKLKYLESEEVILRGCKSEFIVKLYEIINHKDWKILVLQYCEGGNLREYQKNKGGIISENEAIHIVSQIMMAFAYLHQRHIMHRDLKSENILLSQGVFKLADFGLATEKQQLTVPGTLTTVGSMVTMAPQIFIGQKYSTSADLWSLGIVFYEMITNITPFAKKVNESIINRFYENIDNLNIKATTKSFLKKVVIINPQKRLTWAKAYKMWNDQTGLFTGFISPQVQTFGQKTIPQEKPNFQKKKPIDKKPQQPRLQYQSKANLNIEKQENKQIPYRRELAKQQQYRIVPQQQNQKYQNYNNLPAKQQLPSNQLPFVKLIDNYSRIQIIDNTLRQLTFIINKNHKNYSQKSLLYAYLLISSQILQIIKANNQYLYEDDTFQNILIISDNNQDICEFNRFARNIIKQNKQYFSMFQTITLNQNRPITQKEGRYLFYKCSQEEHVQQTISSISKIEYVDKKYANYLDKLLIFLKGQYRMLIRQRMK